MARTKSPELSVEVQRQARLEEEGGIFYEALPAGETEQGEAPGIVNILGVEVPSYATAEDIAAIRSEMVLSSTDQDMLRTIAECYVLRQPMMLEGDPGSGKTFLQKQFVRLVHGAEAPILRLAGTPRTSELDILGHWAPRGLDEREETSFQNTLHELINDPKDIGNKELAMAALHAVGRLRPDTEWEFKRGALLQAYSGREGRGYILMVDEFNLIPANYQQIFLEISGEHGAMSDAIHFWGDGGVPTYPRGEDAWICFASNFPEQTPGRNEVVAPMTDRLVWKVIDKKEAQAKEEAVIRSLGGQIDAARAEVAAVSSTELPVPANELLAWREIEGQQLAYEVADIIQAFHKAFKEAYEQAGDEIPVQGDEHRTRRQQFEFSARNAMRACAYIDRFQIRNPYTEEIDLPVTVSAALWRHYIERLMSAERRDQANDTLSSIMTGEVGTKLFEGEKRTRAEILNLLVERATMTPERKAKRAERDRKQKERETEQKGRAREAKERELADKLSDLANAPDTPEAVRDLLKPVAEAKA